MRLNRAWRLIEDDINKVSSEKILQAAGLEVGQADMLIGGPPCQPFSKSGYWVRGNALRLDDPRADTLTGFLRVLRDAQPRAFLLENVYGLIYSGKDEGFRYLLDGIAQINRDTGSRYEVSHQLINCADYGVPQIRERVFMIGSRDGRKFRFPEPTHARSDDHIVDLFETREPYRTAWDAIGDLPEPYDPSLLVGGKWGALLPTIPEGENYLWHTDRGGGSALFGWRTRYWSFSAEAVETPSVVDYPGTAGLSHRPFSLEKPAAHLCGTLPYSDVSGWPSNRLRADRDAASAWQRGAVTHC